MSVDFPPARVLALRINELSKTFGVETVLDRISLDVQKGEVLGIIGQSGSGKSTLLRCINALEHYDSGEVFLNGDRVTYTGNGRRRRRFDDRKLSAERARIGMVFQNFNLFPHMTAWQNVALGPRKVRRLSPSDAKELAMRWLKRVGLETRAHYYPYQMSGGQQQRVAIARAVAMSPELLLLDEVTSALDPALVAEVLFAIKELAETGMTMLIVSHELPFIREVADNVAFMHGGRLVAKGPPATLFSKSTLPELVAFLGASFSQLTGSTGRCPMSLLKERDGIGLLEVGPRSVSQEAIDLSTSIDKPYP